MVIHTYVCPILMNMVSQACLERTFEPKKDFAGQRSKQKVMTLQNAQPSRPLSRNSTCKKSVNKIIIVTFYTQEVKFTEIC